MGHAELEGKDKGSKGGGLTVHITYGCGKGRMDVNVPAFLRMRKMGRYKKLMALIRQSDTPGEAERITEYIRQALDSMDVRIQDTAGRALGARTAAREMQPAIDQAAARRDMYKRQSEPYRILSQQVKDLRQSQRVLNGMYRGYEADFKGMQRDRDFYQKIIAEGDKG